MTKGIKTDCTLFLKSKLTSNTFILPFGYLCVIDSKTGSSSTHGLHHVAQKLIIIGFPLLENVLELIAEPSNFFTVAEGILSPSEDLNADKDRIIE